MKAIKKCGMKAFYSAMKAYLLTPEELEEFHRDAIKLMEESEQQKEVALQG